MVSDPRTTLAQATHALQAAELVDRDSWHLLCEVTEKLGHGELASRFRQAARDEERHLKDVRSWNRSFALAESGAEAPSTAARA